MDYYYILESGELTTSKWEKQPGDVHRNTKVKHVITKEEYDAINAELARRRNAEYRASKKETDLWFAGIILKAGQEVGVDVKDTLACMKQFSPASFNALKSELKKR